ncbi:alpha/beta hydrolase [Clostridium sp.]|uniref:alpha/beta fold hydrolase n=1 Tax=Clostridium sp. TaxID=1506 RepID=UPI003216ECF6
MINIRKYGSTPYSIAVIHGGPGAPGGMAPVAKEISKKYGVLEPMQSEDSIDGQVFELKDFLERNGEFPVILIGHSWGAWLSYIFASRYPNLVSEIILVGSGSYEDTYLSSMNSKRENRLTEEENLRVGVLFQLLNEPNNPNKKEVLREFGELMAKADSFSPICIENESLDFQIENESLDFQPEVFQNCMKEINKLRSSGELLELGKAIKCPVIAIHGEYDSHSFEGVEKPLSKVIKNFEFILLKDCGHSPWNEVHAKDKFYEIIFSELDSR